MSSLTDIIFLLLIFFMLTANFIQVHNIELPESDSKTIASTSITVTIDRTGQYYLNGAEITSANLEGSVSTAVAGSENSNATTVTIVAETGVPFERVSRIMGIASRLKVKAILATQPRG